MSEKHFKSKKNDMVFFPYVGGVGGVSEHMENSICLTVFIFESFPYSKVNSKLSRNKFIRIYLIIINDFNNLMFGLFKN